MDNNFDDFSNGLNSFEPQKPFTDKSSQSDNSADDKSPWQNEPIKNTSDDSNPIYGNNFSPSYNNTNPAPQNIPYGNPQYGAPQYRYMQQPANNFAKPNTNIPPYNGVQAPNEQSPYAPFGGYTPKPNPPKKRMNGGLIALIVVLCVLLSSSLTGIGVYIACNRVNNTNSNSNDKSNGFYYNTPGSTLPQQNETVPQSNHDESDYSDKIKEDFDGISLKNKPKDSPNSKYNAEYAYNMVSDSVVGIVCYDDEITTVEECSSQGSGIVITSDGYVVTNAHVIGNSNTAYLIQVITADGKAYSAGVVGFDSRTDIAVLKMDDTNNLKSATFGNSDDIELGEDIIAVGNPGGLDYQNSITKGIVSAVNRSLSSSSLVKYIQTDAAINPGNSGGPIVNLYGQVIGIATSKIVSEKYEGMGFAIPSATAKNIINDLIKQGYISGRVKIGITGMAINAAMASSSNVPQGIYVQEISHGGPCDGTELRTEDIITEADGETVTSFADIYKILGNHKAGDKIQLKYYRMSNGSEGTVEVTLQEDK